MIKDIPFVTNISKDYDKDILDLKYDDLLYKKSSSNNSNRSDKRIFDTIADQGNQFDFSDIKDSHITNTINRLNGLSNQDELSKALQAQSNYDIDNSSSQEHLA